MRALIAEYEAVQESSAETMVRVPSELVPRVRELIGQHRLADQRKR